MLSKYVSGADLGSSEYFHNFYVPVLKGYASLSILMKDQNWITGI